MLNGTPIFNIEPPLRSVPDEDLRRSWLAEAGACQNRAVYRVRFFSAMSQRERPSPVASCSSC